VAFARGGKSVASGSGDRSIRIWNGKPPAKIDVQGAVMALAYSPDGNLLASGTDGNAVQLHDARTHKPLQTIDGHKDTVVSLAFSPDSKTLFSGSLDRTIRQADFEKKAATVLVTRHPGDCAALTLSPDGKVLAVAGTNNTIRRFEAQTGKEMLTAEVPQAGVTSLACSPDGKLIASAGTDTIIRLWDAASSKEIKRWGGSGHADLHLAWSPDGKTLASGGGGDGVRTWDTDGKELRHLDLKERDPVLCLASAPKGDLLAVGYRTGGVRIWDTSKGQWVKQFPYPDGVHALAWFADGKFVAGAGSHKIALWDIALGQKLHDLGKNAPVASLAFSPDGRKLAAGMYDSTIPLYDLADPKEFGREYKVIEGHTSAVYALSFSPNGRVLTSGSYDKTVRVWETVNGLQVNAWSGHLGPVSAVAVAPGARKVVSGSADGTLLVWDMTGMLKDGTLPAVDLQVGALDGLWGDLAADDNPRGNRALWTMAAGGKVSAPYLTKKVFLADPKKIAQYIADLNDNKFAVRERASAALAGYGRWIEGVLKDAAKNPPSDEVRRRVDRLLAALKGSTLDQERLRARRVIEVLEQANTPEAQALLRSLSLEAAEEDLRQTAAGALARLTAK